MIGGRTADDWIEQAGDTPLFVYDVDVIRARIALFRSAMSVTAPVRVGLHYAVKANPFPPLLAAIGPLVDGLDVASIGEGQLALAAKPAERISFAGPGKRDDELREAIAAGITINLESEGEADRALSIAERLGAAPRLAVRVNPEVELRGSGMRMGGRASPFGVDADRAAALAQRVIAAGAEWRGWHIFAGSQALSAPAIIETQAATLALAGRLSDDVGVTPPLVNMGGGFGIPYFPGEQPLDVQAIADALAEALDGRAASIERSQFALELGRWLVGEAGVYLTRVIDRKVSRSETFLVTDGGLNHQLAATGNLGTVVRRNYPIAVANAEAGRASEVGQRRWAAVYPARSARRSGRTAARGGRRRHRRLHGRCLWTCPPARRGSWAILNPRKSWPALNRRPKTPNDIFTSPAA